MNNQDSKDDELTLELLDAIEQRSDVSQRHLANKLGIALGLTNSYLKRCARKGYVKVKAVPANRYLYFLTPKGFAEKSRITARFLSASLSFYRQSAESCSELFDLCEKRKWRRVLLCGVSDLAEIAYMRSAGYGITIVGVYDPKFDAVEFSGLPAWHDWQSVSDADACMITGLDDPLQAYWDVRKRFDDEVRILVPSVLSLGAAIKNR